VDRRHEQLVDELPLRVVGLTPRWSADRRRQGAVARAARVVAIRRPHLDDLAPTKAVVLVLLRRELVFELLWASLIAAITGAAARSRRRRP